MGIITSGQASDRRLSDLLGEIRRLPECGSVERLSVALYDHQRNCLRSLAAASIGHDPLKDYEIDLEEVPSLAILATGDAPRIVDDLFSYGRDSSVHTTELRAAGYHSSLTMPVSEDGYFIGFVFFNAVTKRAFTPAAVGRLLPYCAAILAMVRRTAS
ncbi:MAG: hypothetical protein H7Z12_14310 [Rhodospirillaceae bacterium]|nr:hypothetical protein [Rhodospirillales bacterium]